MPIARFSPRSPCATSCRRSRARTSITGSRRIPAQIDVEALKRDEYRLCSAYVADTLWLGNDAEVLGRWLARVAPGEGNPDARAATARPDDGAQPKLAALARPRELFDAGRLHPDPEVNERTRTLLSDLVQYRTSLLTVSTLGQERQIDVVGTFLLR